MNYIRFIHPKKGLHGRSCPTLIHYFLTTLLTDFRSFFGFIDQMVNDLRFVRPRSLVCSQRPIWPLFFSLSVVRTRYEPYVFAYFKPGFGHMRIQSWSKWFFTPMMSHIYSSEYPRLIIASTMHWPNPFSRHREICFEQKNEKSSKNITFMRVYFNKFSF